MYIYRTSVFNEEIKIKQDKELSSRINSFCQKLEEMNEKDVLKRFTKFALSPYLKRNEGKFRLIARIFSVGENKVLCLLRVFKRADIEYRYVLENIEDFFGSSLEEDLTRELSQWLKKKIGKMQIIREQHQVYHFVEKLIGVELPFQMIQIPSGNFVMGAPKSEIDSEDRERPQHLVAVNSFFLGRYPITNAQWNFVVNNLSQEQRELSLQGAEGKEEHPVTGVSWYNAMEFCARLSSHTSKKYRLPSEAEWEYACRAVNSFSPVVKSEQLAVEEWNQRYIKPFHFGETISSEVANYQGDETYGRESKGKYRGITVPVDHFQAANDFGLSQMHGQVYEWCADPWHDNYEKATSDGMVWDKLDNNHYRNVLGNLSELLNDKRSRVLRGGSFYEEPGVCRSASRVRRYPGYVDADVSFRLAVSDPRTL